jgi:hypothetical protein
MAQPALTTAYGLYADQMQVLISKSVEFLIPTLDPVWRDMIVSSQGVKSTTGFGRDLIYRKVYQDSMSGVIRNGLTTDEMALYGDQYTGSINTPKLRTRGTPVNAFPDPREGANHRPIPFAVRLGSALVSLDITLGEELAEQNDGLVGQIIAPKLLGFARRIGLYMCNSWYTSQNTNYSLAVATEISAETSDGGTFFTTFKPANLAVDRFYVGQLVDWHQTGPNGVFSDASVRRLNDTANTPANQNDGTRINLVVAAVDELKGTVTVAYNTARASWGGGNPASLPDNRLGFLTESNMRRGTQNFEWFAGINSYLKGGTGGTDNVLLGNEAVPGATINVNTHPQFKSFVKAGVGTLTETKFRQYLDAWTRAKTKYGQYVDTFFASDGVWTNYLEQKTAREYLDRTGRVASINSEGSDDGFTFVHKGKTYKGYTSNFIEANTVYGMRLGGQNWQRVVPPRLSGTKSMQGVEPFVPLEIVSGKLMGTGASHAPYFSSTGQLTDLMQINGIIRMQVVADKQPAGIKLTDVAESRVYSD